MAITFEEIVATVRRRQAAQVPLLRRMEQVRDRYNGDWILPLPEQPDEPAYQPMTPLLIAASVDGIAQAAASVRPMIFCPPTNAGESRPRQYAQIRRRAYAATWKINKFDLRMRRFFRHLTAYASASIVTRPAYERRDGMELEYPFVEARNPLSSFPDARTGDDLRPPENCAFIFSRSAEWIRSHFPVSKIELGGILRAAMASTEVTWDLVEWMDAENTVIGIMGPRSDTVRENLEPRTSQMELARYPNRVGRCTVQSFNVITLDRIVSHVANMLGIVDLQAKLWMLNLLAQEAAVFPDRYAVGVEGREPTLVGDQWHSGSTGKINMLKNVQKVDVLRTTPDPATMHSIDALERNFRVSSGIVPQMGGETYGAMRTGKAIDSLYAAAVDPRVQEIHEIAQHYLAEMNRDIAATYKAYWGSKQFSLYTGSITDSIVEFVPDKHFETEENAVQWPVAGADQFQTGVALAQALGTDAISRHTYRMLHPMIHDPEAEEAFIEEETLEKMAMQALQMQVTQGQLPLTYLADIEKELRSVRLAGDGNLFEAIRRAHDKLQQQQAAPMGAPVPGGAQPEAMPGVNTAAGPGQVPGPGAPGGPLPPEVAPPTPNLENLKSLTRALNATAPRG